LVFVPHQDDELLVMGPAIRNAVASGRDLHVVLFGLGDGTVVRTRDMPKLLGRDVSGEEIGSVRDAEFHLSCKLLGLPVHRVLMADPRQPEKAFATDTSRDVMAGHLKRLPEAEVWTLSEFDENADHAGLGLAAKELATTGVMDPERARLFVAPWYRGTMAHPPLSEERADIGYREQRPYRYTDVDAGLWGVGYKSVKRYFNGQLKNPASYSYLLTAA
jgi:LmbE family N-acetylglucosaminyl deacetylase